MHKSELVLLHRFHRKFACHAKTRIITRGLAKRTGDLRLAESLVVASQAVNPGTLVKISDAFG